MTAVLQAFGLIGVVSVLLWIGAMALLSLAVQRRVWFRWALRAVVCALLGLLVAKWNSARVSAIEVDRSDLVRQALDRHREAQIRDGEEVSSPRFAETSAADSLAQAGSLSETALATGPAYRKRGKQARETGNGSVGGAIIGDASQVGADAGESGDDSIRRMKQVDVDRANRWDRWNLLLARSLVWITLGGAGLLLVRRFNRITGSGPPLRLAAPWIDAFSRKDHQVIIEDRDDALRWFVARAVRKGEGVLAFGQEIVAAGTVLRTPGAFGGDEVRVRNATDPGEARDLFESVWYGLTVGQITDPVGLPAWLKALREFVEMRRFTRARARATVNVIVAETALHSRAPALAELGEMVPWFEDLNFRLVVAGSTAPPELGPLPRIDVREIEMECVLSIEQVWAGRLWGWLNARLPRGVRTRIGAALVLSALAFPGRLDAAGLPTEEPIPVVLEFTEPGGKTRAVKGTLRFEEFPVRYEGQTTWLKPLSILPKQTDQVHITRSQPGKPEFEFVTNAGSFRGELAFQKLRVEIGAMAQLDRVGGGDLTAALVEEVSLEEQVDDDATLPVVFESDEPLAFQYLDVDRILAIKFPIQVPASEEPVSGRFLEFSKQARGSGGRVQVAAATFVGGGFDETVMAAGFLPDGGVVAVVSAVDTSWVPEAAILGRDPDGLAQPEAPKAEDKGFPRALIPAPGPRSGGAEAHVAPVLLRFDPDLKRIEQAVRLPFGVMTASGMAVGPDGAVTLWGGTLPHWKAIGEVQRIDNPAAADSAKARSRPFDPDSGSLIVRLDPGLERVAWARFYQADGVQVFARRSGNMIVRAAKGFEELKPTGESIPAGIDDPAIAGQRRGLAFNPVDATWYTGGDYNSQTGHEPYRNPWLRKYTATGSLEWAAWDWTGPVVGVKRYRLVSDSAVRQIRFLKNGDLLIGGWSDGGNTVFFRLPYDLSTAHNLTGFAASLWGASVLSVGHLQRLDPRTMQVRAATTYTSFTPLNNKPNSIFLSDLAELENGSIAVVGASATGLIETHDAWTEPWISMTQQAAAAENPTHGVKSGPFFALFGPNFKDYHFCSVVPGLRAQRVAVRGHRALVYGAATFEPKTDGTRDGSILKNPVQAKFGGGNTDGYLLLIDTSEVRAK